MKYTLEQAQMIMRQHDLPFKTLTKIAGVSSPAQIYNLFKKRKFYKESGIIKRQKIEWFLECLEMKDD